MAIYTGNHTTLKLHWKDLYLHVYLLCIINFCFGFSGLLTDVFQCIAQHLTFQDLMAVFFGQPEPLNRTRRPLQNFIRTRILNDGQATEENVHSAVDRLIVDMQPDVIAACVSLNPSNAKTIFILSTKHTLSCWYSLDSSLWVLPDEYPYARVSVIFYFFFSFFASFFIGQTSHQQHRGYHQYAFYPSQGPSPIVEWLGV